MVEFKEYSSDRLPNSGIYDVYIDGELSGTVTDDGFSDSGFHIDATLEDLSEIVEFMKSLKHKRLCNGLQRQKEARRQR